MIATAEISEPEELRDLPPLSQPVLLFENGTALVADPFGGEASVPARAGLAMGWAPAPEIDGVLLSLFAGAIDAGVGVVVLLSREGLDALASDLRSIRRQLCDPS